MFLSKLLKRFLSSVISIGSNQTRFLFFPLICEMDKLGHTVDATCSILQT